MLDRLLQLTNQYVLMNTCTLSPFIHTYVNWPQASNSSLSLPLMSLSSDFGLRLLRDGQRHEVDATLCLQTTFFATLNYQQQRRQIRKLVAHSTKLVHWLSNSLELRNDDFTSAYVFMYIYTYVHICTHWEKYRVRSDLNKELFMSKVQWS